jgi:hypothetical protein
MKEQLMELEHKVLFSMQYGLIGKICLICQRNHLETNCPEVVLSARLREEHVNQHNFNRRIGCRRKGTKQFKVYQIQTERLKRENRMSISLFANLANLIPLAEIIR